MFYYSTPRPDSVIEFTLSGVDATKLSVIEARFHQLLKEVADKEVDMAYMADCLNREKRQQMYLAESNESYFTQGIISTFLFSKTGDLTYLANLKEFDELNEWTAEDWRRFLRKWLVDNNHVTILGKPSAALSKKITEDEEARIASQIKNLGPEGLKKLHKKLEDAKNYNDREIPRELLEKFKVPATDTIHFISTTSARSGYAKELGIPRNSIQEIVDQDKPALPLFIHFEHIPSNFINVHLLICTASIPVHLRPLVTLYMENFFTTPIVRGGTRIEFEQVVMELFRDTVEYSIGSGGELGNSEVLNVKFQIEKDKYGKAIGWIKDLLWNSIFDIERLKSTTVRLLADIPEEKRDGSDMSYAASDMINDAAGSIERARDTLVKALYLKRLKRLLSDEPKTVIEQLEDLRSTLCQASNFRILVVANVQRLEKPVSAWEDFIAGKDCSKPPVPLDKKIDRFSDAGKNPGNLSYIIPMSTLDSSFLLTVSKGPEDSKHPCVPALMVAIAYLDAVEGPMWTAVRGTGLAYGTGFRRRIGRLEYSVYRSPDSFKALSVSKKVVEDFVNGLTPFDSLALEGAISSIVLTLANQQATMGAAATDKFVLEVVKDLPRNWNDLILEKVRAVKVDEIKAVMKDMLLPLFDTKSSNVFITCAPIMEGVSPALLH